MTAGPAGAGRMDATAQKLERLVDRLGAGAVLTEHGDMIRYLRDWPGDVEGRALAVLRPDTTQAVAQAVRLCAELGLGIVPQGGNTGLTEAGTPQGRDQVVISLERLNRIRSMSPDDFAAVVEAGCVLETLKAAVDAADRYFPLALGAQGSCQIGGNVSTNAGGINVLRYGMTRDLILGLEVVLADGTIWDGLSVLRKDNRGIDLKQLFIGAEGTLGIVTAVAIKLLPRPEHVETALVALPSVGDVMALYRRARPACCDLISAFELMRPEALAFARDAYPDLAYPIPPDYPAYALMELTASGPIDLRAILDAFLEAEMEAGTVLDGVVAASRQQALNLWKIREGMNEGQALRGMHLRTDISVPLSRVADYIAEASEAIAAALPQCDCAAYGHVGDGNIHFNVLPPRGTERAAALAIMAEAKSILYAILDRFDGSISAEHGIGRAKKADFTKRLEPAQAGMLIAIKQALDPQWRMNPGSQLDRPQ
ncbi:FAD-binding oxidoreductase [Aureimonas frigidaquae]|uniref:FAD-binding oxidoreductase n=1 Tax=Aureimonas frigidaquae TaxID=424757 RepID=UPI0009FA36D6